MSIPYDRAYDHFMMIDWCKNLITHPGYRVATIETPPLPEGALLGHTLRTKDTIKASICLLRIENSTVVEFLTLFDIGSGLNGLPNASHGGMIATFLDEACGLFVAGLLRSDTDRTHAESGGDEITTIWPNNNTATIYLNVTYLKFVYTPSVIAVRCWLKSRSGRKLFVDGHMEDKDGQVLAKVESLFVFRRDASI